MQEMKDIQSILFISFDHIGDILRFTPLLRNLRLQYPGAYIATLMPAPQSGILKYYPYVNDVISFEHAKLKEQAASGASLAELVYQYGYALVEALRHINFDLVINPYGDIGAVFAGLIKPKNILGRGMTAWGEYTLFGENAARVYYSFKKEREFRIYAEERLSDVMLTLLRDLGIDDNDVRYRKPELFLGCDDELFAEKFLEENDIKASEYVIGLQTSAMVKKGRSWPIDKFAAFINRINDAYEVRCMLFGDKTEGDMLERDLLPVLNKEPVMAAGKTTILQAGALLKRLDLLISVDTGPMHMAACLDVPIIALFGRATCVVNEARPYGEKHTVIVANTTKDITVDEVAVAVDAYVNVSSKVVRMEPVKEVQK